MTRLQFLSRLFLVLRADESCVGLVIRQWAIEGRVLMLAFGHDG